MISSTIEDYVKRVFILQQESQGETVSMGRLSAAMGITPGTATTMVKGMADDGLLEYQPRVGVKLTPRGREVAVNVLRRHRIAEAFLVEVLGMDWAEVHDDAERLEHAISPAVLERMDAFLNRPTHDPHGDPIPALDGNLKPAARNSLAGGEPGKSFVVSRILDQSQEFLTFVREVGLSPGEHVAVVSRNQVADSMVIRAGSSPDMAISLRVAAKIAVEPAATGPIQE